MTDNASTGTGRAQADERTGEQNGHGGGSEGTSSSEDGIPFGNRDDVEYEETSYVHDGSEFCARDTDGRVIVGVTNGDGEVLLLVNDDRGHAILPNCHVEDGDWRAVARRTVEESTGITIGLGGPELVRAVEHRIEGDDDPSERTYHVIFGGSPTDDSADLEPTCDDDEWRAEYCVEIPMEIDSEHGDVKDDIERFLE